MVTGVLNLTEFGGYFVQAVGHDRQGQWQRRGMGIAGLPEGSREVQTGSERGTSARWGGRFYQSGVSRDTEPAGHLSHGTGSPGAGAGKSEIHGAGWTSGRS